MEIFVCVRRTLDWGDEARVLEGLRPDFRPKLEAWNATFDLPYHAFRQRLKEIARRSLEGVAGATCATLEDVPPGAIVVPVDDDDWIAPDLATRIRGAGDASACVFVWSLHLIELPRRWTLRSWLWRLREPALRCSTNNYAVRNDAELRPLLESHMRATAWARENPDRVARIAGTLSVQNRNLSSQTAMAWGRPSITREELVASHGRYRVLYDALTLPTELAWARPYVDAMAALMRDVRVRRAGSC